MLISFLKVRKRMPTLDTDFWSKQSVRVVYSDDLEIEVTFDIGLRCTLRSSPGYFNPIYGGEPPSGPEFDITTIEVVPQAPMVKCNITFTYNQFYALLGPEIAENLIDRALDEAYDSGGF
jgi:hypothetical protein